MNKKLSQLIDESIKHELNIADIYMLFYIKYPEDSDFWWKMSLEEKSHSDLIKSGKDTFQGQFPSKLLSPSLQMLCDSNNKLSLLLKECNEKTPSREKAFNIALDIEESISEIHFQIAMEKTFTSSIMKIFQELNSEDKNHAIRIRAYMNSKGIERKKHTAK